MNNYLKIYWLTRLDSFVAISITFLVLSIVGLIIWYVLRTSSNDKEDYDMFTTKNKFIKKILIYATIFGMLGTIFIPTKDDMIMIYAGGKTMNYVQSDTALSKIPYQTTTIISEYLDKTLKELKTEK